MSSSYVPFSQSSWLAANGRTVTSGLKWILLFSKGASSSEPLSVTLIILRNMLHINDDAGESLLAILPPIPDHLVDGFFDALRIRFPDFKDTDSKKEGSKHKFPAAHIDIYGRYTNRVCPFSFSLLFFF